MPKFQVAVSDYHGAVEETEGVACAGKGTHCEVACGLVDKGQVAVVGHGVVGGNNDGLVCTEDVWVCAAVPAVGKA